MRAGAVLPTLKSYVYTRVLPKFLPAPKTVIHDTISGIPVAAICDWMTWINLCHFHSTVALTPSGWVSEIFARPKFLFCEAAWCGIARSCWRGQIYKDRRVLYENRKHLLEILRYCKSNAIPTVFWAKEDPAYFRHEIYDFTDTALMFDHILTTAKEAVQEYISLGHRSVHLWPFGFSPHIYYPPGLEDSARENVAVFAGSWFREHKKRCHDLEMLFEMLLDAGIPLRIYDRNKRWGVSFKPFPEKYQRYVLDRVEYEELGKIYRSSSFAINVNTVGDSETMFSRRVYEAAACGAIVVSNDSKGLKSQFGENIWFLGERFDTEHIGEIRERNIRFVFENHTWQKRFEKLCEILGEECI